MREELIAYILETHENNPRYVYKMIQDKTSQESSEFTVKEELELLSDKQLEDIENQIKFLMKNNKD